MPCLSVLYHSLRASVHTLGDPPTRVCGEPGEGGAEGTRGGVVSRMAWEAEEEAVFVSGVFCLPGGVVMTDLSVCLSCVNSGT